MSDEIDRTSDREAATDALPSTVVATLTTVLATQSPGLAIMVAAVSPPAIEVLTARFRATRMWTMLSGASRRARIEAETLITDVGSSEAGAVLLVRSIEAAGVAPSGEHLNALSRALADCVGNPSAIDQSALIVAAIATLQTPHVSLLGVMDGTPRSAFGLTYTAPLDPTLTSATREELSQARPAYAPVIDALLSTLVACGAVQNRDAKSTWASSSSEIYSITDFGHLLLGYLREHLLK